MPGLFFPFAVCISSDKAGYNGSSSTGVAAGYVILQSSTATRSNTHTHIPWSRKPSTKGFFNSVHCFLLTGFWPLCAETLFCNSRHRVNGEMCMEVGRRRSMHAGLKLFLCAFLTWNRELLWGQANKKKIFKWGKDIHHKLKVNT